MIQGETEKAYKARISAMGKKYDDAVAVLASQKYQQALTLFNEIVPEVPSGYRELAQKRDEARAGIRTEGKTALAAAEAAGKAGDMDTAWDAARRARQLDPGPQTDAVVQRIAGNRAARAERSATKAKSHSSTGILRPRFPRWSRLSGYFRPAIPALRSPGTTCRNWANNRLWSES